MEGKPLITVSHVRKRFKGKKTDSFLALQDVSFEVIEGEVVSVIGASGCGKTTLLRMMAGLTSYDAGEIRMGGNVVRGIPPRVGFVFQSPSLFPWRTVRENVAAGLGPERSSLSQGEQARRINTQIELVGLNGFESNYPHQLSGGMQQRVGLARALVSEPDVLLLDEPLGSLDAFTRMRIQQELADILERTRTTSIFVTHDVDEAVFFSDVIIVMQTGPGRIAEIVPVPLDRPRQRSQMFGNPEVMKVRDQVLTLATQGQFDSASAGVGEAHAGTDAEVRMVGPSAGGRGTIGEGEYPDDMRP